MKIEFADSRPAGDFALVLPSTGTTRPGVEKLADKAKVGNFVEIKNAD